MKKYNVPLVVIMITGRPLIITEHLNDWDSLLVAWLPGSEGGGVSDILFGDYKPTGKLAFSWRNLWIKFLWTSRMRNHLYLIAIWINILMKKIAIIFVTLFFSFGCDNDYGDYLAPNTNCSNPLNDAQDETGLCCPSELLDCNGLCYGLNQFDDCGICGGNNIAVLDVLILKLTTIIQMQQLMMEAVVLMQWMDGTLNGVMNLMMNL